jgi:hypothetical protein
LRHALTCCNAPAPLMPSSMTASRVAMVQQTDRCVCVCVFARTVEVQMSGWSSHAWLS